MNKLQMAQDLYQDAPWQRKAEDGHHPLAGQLLTVAGLAEQIGQLAATGLDEGQIRFRLAKLINSGFKMERMALAIRRTLAGED